MLCKVLRCSSVRLGDTTERANCIELNFPGDVLDMEEANSGARDEGSPQQLTCLLRVAHDSTQCPRCRLYRSINKSLCARCEPLVPNMQKKVIC